MYNCFDVLLSQLFFLVFIVQSNDNFDVFVYCKLRDEFDELSDNEKSTFEEQRDIEKEKCEKEEICNDLAYNRDVFFNVFVISIDFIVVKSLSRSLTSLEKKKIFCLSRSLNVYESFKIKNSRSISIKQSRLKNSILVLLERSNSIFNRSQKSHLVQDLFKRNNRIYRQLIKSRSSQDLFKRNNQIFRLFSKNNSILINSISKKKFSIVFFMSFKKNINSKSNIEILRLVVSSSKDVLIKSNDNNFLYNSTSLN